MRLLVIGAHPDDSDIRAGGIACTLAAQGHTIRFLSLTNGDKGHHKMGGPELANRRRAEADAAADVAGLDAYELFDTHDGELQPTLEERRRVLRYVRKFAPDLVLTHRPNDYHPDHRYTSRIVQDAAFMVTVPGECPDVEPLDEDPVICYLADEFENPSPFDPDVVVPIDEAFVERKYDMLHRHTSQFYEWLAYSEGYLEEVPDDEDARREFLATNPFGLLETSAAVADRFRDRLVSRYGEGRGRDIEYAEAFQACEYGTALTDERVETLFPV